MKDKILEIILNIFDQENIDIMDNKEALSNLIERILINNESTIFDISELNLYTYNNFYSFFYISDDLNDEEMQDKIIMKLRKYYENINLLGKIENFNLFLIVDNIGNKIKMENICKSKKVKVLIKESIKSSKNITIYKDISARNIEYSTLIVCNVSDEHFEININSRIRSLEMKSGHKNNFTGYVFNARLYDIVGIYNKVGNQLFSENLRYSIGDQLQVDSEIKSTLRECPDEFWFLNNGITLIVQDDNFILNNPNKLTINYENEQSISIINGAQTVTASADFFWGPDCSKEEAKDKARVLLRIMHFHKSEAQNCKENELSEKDEMNVPCKSKDNKELISKISISLNRQKPMKISDIVNTMPIIGIINDLKNNNPENQLYFRILKRGENQKSGLELSEFARYIKCFHYQQPGSALNDSATSLLKITSNKETGKMEFDNLSILNEEIEDDKIYFEKYFKAVNFITHLHKVFSEIGKNNRSIYIEQLISEENGKNTDFTNDQIIILEESLNSILSYGRWYFAASVIRTIGAIIPNYTYIWDNETDSIIEDAIKRFMRSIFSNIVEKRTTPLNISDFKVEKIYDQIKDILVSDLKNEILRLDK